MVQSIVHLSKILGHTQLDLGHFCALVGQNLRLAAMPHLTPTPSSTSAPEVEYCKQLRVKYCPEEKDERQIYVHCPDPTAM